MGTASQTNRDSERDFQRVRTKILVCAQSRYDDNAGRVWLLFVCNGRRKCVYLGFSSDLYLKYDDGAILSVQLLRPGVHNESEMLAEYEKRDGVNDGEWAEQMGIEEVQKAGEVHSGRESGFRQRQFCGYTDPGHIPELYEPKIDRLLAGFQEVDLQTQIR